MTSLPDGVSIGQWKDGTEVYVGRAGYELTNEGVSGDYHYGRLNLTSYRMGYDGTGSDYEEYYTSGLEYLSKDPNCHCTFVRCDIGQCFSITNVFKFISEYYGYVPNLMAKIIIKYPCGESSTCNFTTFGALDHYGPYYTDEYGKEYVLFGGVYDVLKCEF